jgi:hypothetical protein
MANQIELLVQDRQDWNPVEKWGFRIFSLFFWLQVLPIDWKFFRQLFTTQLHFKSVLDLTAFVPTIVSGGNLPTWGLASYVNWGLYLLIAIIGAYGWHLYEKRGKFVDYDTLNYWLRVSLRYRLALGLLAFGFYKVFCLQMPYPSLSNLHTNYGDMLPWKVYFQTHAISPNYQSFLGWVEIAAAVLLFNRSTATFGAGLVLGFLGNITAANLFYDIGHHLYASFLVALALAILAYDVPRLYRLIVKELPTSGKQFAPDVLKGSFAQLRIASKSLFVSFGLLLGFLAWSNAKSDPFKTPHDVGLKDVFGYYLVDEFKYKGQPIAFSTTDPKRWQDVVFEKWATVSLKINRPVQLDLSEGDSIAANDIDRNYEIAGLVGRHYFDYEVDSIQHILTLQNKNKNYRNERYVLHYSIQPNNDIILSGVDEKQDSVYARLNKIDKDYMMYEGRRKQVKVKSIHASND